MAARTMADCARGLSGCGPSGACAGASRGTADCVVADCVVAGCVVADCVVAGCRVSACDLSGVCTVAGSGFAVCAAAACACRATACPTASCGVARGTKAVPNMNARMRPMAKSLGSFRAALLIGWGVLGLAGIFYARARGIPGWAAWPVVAAFLIEYPFYLVPAFPTAREHVTGWGIPAFALAAAILPYLACCCGAVQFEWGGLARIAAAALAVSLWYVVLPAWPIIDLAFLALIASLLLCEYFNPIYAPLHPAYKDLKNVIVIPHLALISMAVMALMLQRRVHETGYGFVPSAREWRIGLLHFAYFVPIGLPLALLLGATRFVEPKPIWYIAATFIGMFTVLSLSEEFFVRGVLQQWIEEWTLSRAGALVITSAVFGLLHLRMGHIWNWKWVLVAGVLGWFCGRARNQAGSIRASMVTHALVAATWRGFFA